MYSSGVEQHSDKVQAGGSNPSTSTNRSIAQSGSEQCPYKAKVPGSNPGVSTNKV